MPSLRYYLYYKPFGVLSQFSDEAGHPGLKQFIDVDSDVYPVGRLDRDSEGLLILTNDASLNNALLNPRHQHARTYYVQVEGVPSKQQLEALQRPMDLKVKKSRYLTSPCRADAFETPPAIPDRDPPIRYRAQIPTTWIWMELTEGKNRQVRKMTAHVGLPTLRLVRYAIESITIDGMVTGDLREMDYRTLKTGLRL